MKPRLGPLPLRPVLAVFCRGLAGRLPRRIQQALLRPAVAPSQRHDSTCIMPGLVRSRLKITRRRDGTGVVRAETRRQKNGDASGLMCAMPIGPKDGSLNVREQRDHPFHTGLTKVEWWRADGRRVSMAFGEHIPVGDRRVEPILELNLLIQSNLPSADEGHSRPNPESGRSVASSSRGRSPSA